MKRSFLWHIITRSLFKSTTFLTRFDQEALNGKLGDLSRGSRNTAFLKRFKELCEQKDLSCGILLQESCSKSTAFLTIFDQEALNGEDTSSKSIFEKAFVDQETLNGENTSSKSAQFSRKHFFRKEFLRGKTFRAIFQRSHILSRTQTKVGFPLYK